MESGYLPQLLLSVLIGSFSGSFGHCVGMCGGMVIGINMRRMHHSGLIYKAFVNMMYFLGRVSGYILICVIAFLVSHGLFRISGLVEGVLHMMLGVLVIITGFIFTFMPGALSAITPSGQYAWYRQIFSYALHSNNPLSFYLLGFLNGLLPCGFVYVYVLSAISSDSLSHALLIIVVFGLGTFSSLFLVGILGARMFNSQSRHLLMKFAFILLLYLGGSRIYVGYTSIFVYDACVHSVHSEVGRHGSSDHMMPVKHTCDGEPHH